MPRSPLILFCSIEVEETTTEESDESEDDETDTEDTTLVTIGDDQ